MPADYPHYTILWDVIFNTILAVGITAAIIHFIVKVWRGK